MNIIEKIYENNNYPGLEKLYKLVKERIPKVTKLEVKEFLDNELGEQLLKTTKKKPKKKLGTITANYENELWQLDIFDLSKFASYNSNYKYILCAIDVFTRKAYCRSMKNKDVSDCMRAFEEILASANGKPHSIFSDNDSAFLSKTFSSMLDKNQIAFNVNTIDDHHALGIIDAFAKKLKLTISKKMIRSNTQNWVNNLDSIIKTYNRQKLDALSNISPDKASKGDNNQIIYDINISKAKKTDLKSDLNKGDWVRLKIATKFTKSSDIQFSDRIYIVEEIDAGNITLDNGKTYKRSQLLKITDLNRPAPASTNVIAQANKTAKVQRVLKADGIDPNNAIKTKKQVNNILRIGGIDTSNILTTSRRKK